MTPHHGKAFLFLAAGLLLVSACSKKPLLSGGTTSSQTDATQIIPGTVISSVRQSGVRDFPRLLSQLSSGLGVATIDPTLQGKLVDAFGAPPQISGTADFTYFTRTLEYVGQMNYQTTDQRRSTALEANRLRLVSAFCEVSVTKAAALGATDSRRGIYLNVNLATMVRADAERFINAAVPVFRRNGTIAADEIDTVATTMASVATTISIAAGWASGCTMMAGDSYAGEL